MNGIYFYKLQSPYPNDVTKNCKLTINEIDSNFLFLEDKDIKECMFDRDSKVLILTRNNGEQLIADLSDVTYNLDVDYDDGCGSEDGATLTISYDGKSGPEKIVVDKLVTIDNLRNVIGHDILTKVITDDTLKGDGTLDSPLTLNKAYTTGSFGPVISIVDTTIGEKLPEKGSYGARYLTKEKVSDYGYLYNFDAVKLIDSHLADMAVRGKEEYCWHVPSKEEWDRLFNSLEPCKYQNHYSADCHIELGKNAGRILKSACGWLEQEECECDGSVPLVQTGCTVESGEVADVEFVDVDDQPSTPPASYIGTDEIGFKAYPVGIAYNDEYKRPIAKFFKAETVFWTTTHIDNNPNQDIYVKILSYDKATIRQEAECPAPYYSVRLVKEYNGSNYYGSEVIDGITYETILVPETGQIWLTSNVGYADGSIDGLKNGVNYTSVNGSQISQGRAMFFINSWNGTSWDRKALANGDTIVVNDCNDKLQYNVEYRVYTDTKCNAILVNTDDLVTERVLDMIIPLIEKEREERISGDTILNQKITLEIQDRENADNQLWIAINNETQERKDADSVIHDAISSIHQVDKDQWDAINAEASARTATDNQIWEALNNEIEGRLNVDKDQWDAINAEASARTESDNQIWEALNNEIEGRLSVDKDQWDAINAEASARTATDNQQWDAINAIIEDQNKTNEKLDEEIERAKGREDEIEGEIIDNSEPYILKVTDGVILKSKDGKPEHNITINFDGNYGTF